MTKAILLYGAPCSGKTMLAHAMAYASGARTFNISPRNVEGRYSGKAVSLMMHMVSSCCHAHTHYPVLRCSKERKPNMMHPARRSGYRQHCPQGRCCCTYCVCLLVLIYLVCCLGSTEAALMPAS